MIIKDNNIIWNNIPALQNKLFYWGAGIMKFFFTEYHIYFNAINIT